eukprot:7533948-Alexandrium_andersonii.AAC.1
MRTVLPDELAHAMGIYYDGPAAEAWKKLSPWLKQDLVGNAFAAPCACSMLFIAHGLQAWLTNPLSQTRPF